MHGIASCSYWSSRIAPTTRYHTSSLFTLYDDGSPPVPTWHLLLLEALQESPISAVGYIAPGLSGVINEYRVHRY